MITAAFKVIHPRRYVTYRISRDQVRAATAPTPETWDCVDCGVNTAPGIFGRTEALRNIKRLGYSKQTFNLKMEVYTVRAAVWKRARMSVDGGCLCIGCLERRLKKWRKPRLKPDDIVFDHPFNALPATKRLLDRRGDLKSWRHLFETR
jgi:hypothetical protein